ncbi:MAG: site-2 protease family protein [Candidatus Krumholzibacteriota bacterium]|jgi:Zn-dependent protease|nr:site-2 protease family protein [Candidatus Krumholzibacteriota bacterium]
MDFSTNQILEWAVALLVVVFSVIVHENAHGMAAERFGDTTARDMGRITMNPLPHVDPIGTIVMPLFAFIATITSGHAVPFIAWAKPVPVNPANFRNPIVHDSYVAAMGPLSNFALAIGGTALYAVVGLVFKHVPALGESGGNSFLFFQLLCLNLIQINIVLAMFNLLPVPPLDGHWILFRFLPPRWGEVLASLRPYGFMILLVLVFTGVLWQIIGPPVNLMINGLIGVVRLAVTAL